jgi:hypothetical protein
MVQSNKLSLNCEGQLRSQPPPGVQQYTVIPLLFLSHFLQRLRPHSSCTTFYFWQYFHRMMSCLLSALYIR